MQHGTVVKSMDWIWVLILWNGVGILPHGAAECIPW
jgi:hypothetical protein